MKDRLIELLISTPPTRLKCVGRAIGKTYTTASGIADHLLANGVIVLPCKVGDTVYYTKAEISEVCRAKVVRIEMNHYTPSTPIWVTIEYESRLIGKHEEKMTEDVFRLLCFDYKEEAEKALAERSNRAAEKNEGKQKKKPDAIYLGFCQHDCEAHYKCPLCGKSFGSWSINMKDVRCPYCKEELGGIR